MATRDPNASPPPSLSQRAAMIADAFASRLLAPRLPHLAAAFAALAERPVARVAAALATIEGRAELARDVAERWAGPEAWGRLAELGVIDPAMVGDPARRFLAADGRLTAAPDDAVEAVTLAAAGGRTLTEAEGYARAAARAAAAAGWRGQVGDLVVWRFLPDAAGAGLDRGAMGGWRLPGAEDVREAAALRSLLDVALAAVGGGRDDAATDAFVADLAGGVAWGRVGGSPESDPFGPLLHLWALGLAAADPPLDLGRPAAMLLAMPVSARGPARIA